MIELPIMVLCSLFLIGAAFVVHGIYEDGINVRTIMFMVTGLAMAAVILVSNYKGIGGYAILGVGDSMIIAMVSLLMPVLGEHPAAMYAILVALVLMMIHLVALNVFYNFVDLKRKKYVPFDAWFFMQHSKRKGERFTSCRMLGVNTKAENTEIVDKDGESIFEDVGSEGQKVFNMFPFAPYMLVGVVAVAVYLN